MPNDNVQTLTLAKPAPDNEVVDMLEKSLARAREGEVIGLAIIEVNRAGVVSNAYTHHKNYHSLNSGAARLAYRLAGEAGD